MTKRKRNRPLKPHPVYRQLWRVVDGAVADTFNSHPEYLSKYERTVRNSITKRVVGALKGFVDQASTRGAS